MEGEPLMTTKKKKQIDNSKSREKAKLRAKGKKVTKGINPATKLPHTESYLRSR